MGNKCDLDYDTDLEINGKEFAEKINAIFYITSALNGTNVNELFHDIGLKYCQKYILGQE